MFELFETVKGFENRTKPVIESRCSTVCAIFVGQQLGLGCNNPKDRHSNQTSGGDGILHAPSLPLMQYRIIGGYE